MNKLPQEFKDKWVAALKGGSYQQGMGMLYNEKADSYCCLGVAAVLCGVELSRLDGKTLMSDLVKLPIPKEFKSEYKQHSSGGWVKKLAMINDNGASFIEIAGYIQKNL